MASPAPAPRRNRAVGAGRSGRVLLDFANAWDMEVPHASRNRCNGYFTPVAQLLDGRPVAA
jgi:hypothetical protein